MKTALGGRRDARSGASATPIVVCGGATHTDTRWSPRHARCTKASGTADPEGLRTRDAPMGAEGPNERILRTGPLFQPFRLGQERTPWCSVVRCPRTGGTRLGESFWTWPRRCVTSRTGPRPPRVSPALADLVNLAVERVHPARWASLTVLRGKSFRTEATSDDRATKADILQYDMGFGPCVDAVRDDSVYVSGDVGSDERWLEWGVRVHDELGVRSVLSQRLRLSSDAGVIAGLNIYSETTDAFDERARATGLVFATHGGLLMNTILANDRVRNLRRALESNRQIGVAMGVLMHQHRLTQAQAFDVLRARARTPTASSPTSRSRSSTPAP